MKNKLIRKIKASVLAVAFIGGTVSVPIGDNNLFGKVVTASAKDFSATFDETTGVLSISGNVTKDGLRKYFRNDKVKKVVCDDKTVFPSDCTAFFTEYRSEEIDLSAADTSKVQIMSWMFEGCSKLKSINLSNWDTSHVKSMDYMFASCTSLEKLDLNNLDTSNVTDMTWMFMYCPKLKSIELNTWDTSNVKLMGAMFSKCSSLTKLDLSGWDTSKVEAMGGMFYEDNNLKRIYVSDKWTINKSIGCFGGDMFYNCEKIVGGNGTKYDPDYIDEKRACIDTPQTPGYLTDINSPQANVSIAGDIALNIAMKKVDNIMKAVFSGPNGEIVITDFSQKDEKGNNRFSYPLNATQFDDQVKLTLYGDDDTDVIYQTDYSINDYIDSTAEYISDDKVLALTNALDNFGKAADNYFNGKHKIIEGISDINADSVQEYAPTFGKDVKLSLVLNSTTALKIYTGSSNVIIDGNKADAIIKNGKKYYEISNIYAQNLCDKHKIIIDGTEYEFSPMSYVYRVLNNENSSDTLKDMAKATYVYAKAAEAYVGE